MSNDRPPSFLSFHHFHDLHVNGSLFRRSVTARGIQLAMLVCVVALPLMTLAVHTASPQIAPISKGSNGRMIQDAKDYKWQPFQPIQRPPIPHILAPTKSSRLQNPIDAFLTYERTLRGLTPRPESSRSVLLRRVTLDLTGLASTPAEIDAFLNDQTPNAYEKVVDRLLASPRYGERWGRHWMDVWRYSDWAGWADGGQVRDSKPFIWRWRDWIVESLNADKGYDRMAQEMLAADELCPEDADALRATGFLVRNFKLLSREQWMEDTVGHTARAFLGLTMHCAKCHDHKYDPVSQQDYYRMRAIFEPHNVRTDRIPGQLDTTKDGLVRAYDSDGTSATFLFIRGDERNPDKNHPMMPGVPDVLGGIYTVTPVQLPFSAAHPDRREFVYRDLITDATKGYASAQLTLANAKTDSEREEAVLHVAIMEANLAVTKAMICAEKQEDAGRKNSDEWRLAATETAHAQHEKSLSEARLALLLAKRLTEVMVKSQPANIKEIGNLQAKVAEAEKGVKSAEAQLLAPPTSSYTPPATQDYPLESTGRRLAFARWLTNVRNPLTARVAANHIWARHFGQGIVPTLAEFGRNGRKPTHPQLLDWLASELMSNGWHMKPLHRLIVTSRAYKMASTPDTINLSIDPDNAYLWRMNSHRLEAEAIRDNVLYIAGDLDETMGGPDIDHNSGLTSHRRSIYLRLAAEKEVPFLKLFDGPSVTECYERRPSVIPQQALALANSELTRLEARHLAQSLKKQVGIDPNRFISEAFMRILSRQPTLQEKETCLSFLAHSLHHTPSTSHGEQVYENLILVLFNHNDFVTVR